jgi:hypothetical protein
LIDISAFCLVLWPQGDPAEVHHVHHLAGFGGLSIELGGAAVAAAVTADEDMSAYSIVTKSVIADVTMRPLGLNSQDRAGEPGWGMGGVGEFINQS